MKNFYCPDFYNGIEIYDIFYYLMGESPFIFNDNIKIKAIFGSFPSMIWNGGSLITGKQSIYEVKDMLKFYQNFDIPLHLTLTNPLLEKKDCYDRWCNTILDLCYNEKNKIIISSPYLEEYIRDKYPKYKFIKSIITTENDRDYLKDLDLYDMVVLPRRVIKNFDFLNNIPQDKRNRFEILCNDPCPISCPYLYDHYKEYAKLTLYQDVDIDKTKCRTIKHFPPSKKDQILPSELKKYEQIGFTEFKISGRSSKINVAFSVTPFLIKPEYQIDVLGYIMARLYEV